MTSAGRTRGAPSIAPSSGGGVPVPAPWHTKAASPLAPRPGLAPRKAPAMPNRPTTPADLRERLAREGWQLTELAGGPWIIYGFNGDAELCVMGRTREQAWRRAAAAGDAPRAASADKASA